jgi:hypothetical protein
MDYIWFWAAKALTEFMIGVGFFVLLFIVFMGSELLFNRKKRKK